ncbi:MAG: D-aminoacyl-tRNA deacylase [Phycisphaerales bacterium]
MIAVVQRVTRASVAVEDPPHRAEIGLGLCVLLGVEVGDGPEEAAWIARKLPRLRIFRDADDRMNRDLADVDGSILLVSQFTLAGDCRKGNRPSFVRAAEPERGRALYEQVAHDLRAGGITVGTGVFGAMMAVDLLNDGPVTLILTRRPDDRS